MSADAGTAQSGRRPELSGDAGFDPTSFIPVPTRTALLDLHDRFAASRQWEG
jgi:hypothetical protein